MNNTYKIDEAMDFEYVKLPRVLFDKRYAAMSPNAKMLYALLLDRVTLSQLNEWQDESGNVYIIYTRKEAAAQLGMTPNSAVRVFKELKRFELVYEKRIGLGKPNLLFICKPKCLKKADSRVCKNEIQECEKSEPIKTDNIKTDNIKTDNQSIYQDDDGLIDELFLEKLKEQCEIDIFYGETRTLFENAIERIYYSEKLKVGGAVLPQRKLRSLLTGLTADALIQVFDSLNDENLNIKRPIPYVMSAIINAIGYSA